MGLFQDSLKKWFYTNNSSAASSDARVPLLNANGTPKGSDTMVNLASVLGGWLSFPRSKTVEKLNASQLKDIPFGYDYIENKYYSELGLPTGYRWKVMSVKETYDALEIAISLDPVKVLAREFTNGKWTEWYNVI